MPVLRARMFSALLTIWLISFFCSVIIDCCVIPLFLSVLMAILSGKLFGLQQIRGLFWLHGDRHGWPAFEHWYPQSRKVHKLSAGRAKTTPSLTQIFQNKWVFGRSELTTFCRYCLKLLSLRWHKAVQLYNLNLWLHKSEGLSYAATLLESASFLWHLKQSKPDGTFWFKAKLHHFLLQG